MQHYQAAPHQQARIALLDAFLDRTLDALPERDALLAEDGYQHPFWDEVDGLALADAFLAEAGPDGQPALVDALVFPRSLGHDETEHRYTRQRLAQIVSRAGVAAYPDAYGFQALERRVRHMLTHGYEDSDHGLLFGYSTDAYWHQPASAWATPDLEDCLELLAGFAVDDAWLDLAHWLLGGEWDHPCPSENVFHKHLAEAYQGKAAEALRHFAVALAETDRLDGALHERAVRTWADSLCTLPPLNEGHSPAEQRLDALNAELIERNLAQLPDTSGLFRLIGKRGTSSPHWLLAGVREVARLGLEPGTLRVHYEDICGRVLIALLDVGQLEKDDEAELAKQLADFPRTSLLTALPFSGAASEAVLDALGWSDLKPLQRLYLDLALAVDHSGRLVEDLQSSDDPELGVVDRDALQAALDQADAGHLADYLAALEGTPWAFPNTRLLLDAFRGLERKALEKKLQRHAQAALRAYGLLPISGADETRERYLALKRYHREVERYGAERQANSQAAIQAGLENLARTAGHGDATRLEWAMEAEIAEQTPDRLHLDGYDLWLELQGLNPVIVAGKGGKRLKSVPAALRKHEDLAELKTLQARMKDQIRRFRLTLEAMMARGEALELTQLRQLLRMPAARLLLDHLVLRDGDGQLGWLDGDAFTLCSLAGPARPIEGPLLIAHPLHLFEAGALSAWQQALVAQRRVQPFKQVFRELYLLTPAERENGLKSLRFAGHVLRSAVAARLLRARGWTTHDGEEVFRNWGQGLYAFVDFPDAQRYLPLTETITLQAIEFVRDRAPLPLEEVPPLVFSETLRDADLIVSVAFTGETGTHAGSAEVIQRRAELVQALVGNLGLANVRCEGHHAHITGSRARYRLHLGSGVIHIEPGNYLCIVPAGKPADDLYLPFADSDARTSEIISKLFLLLDDGAIDDPSILEQIRRSEVPA
ncbi:MULTISPECIES: DUF4132 domain-containing protein [unclassified Pseudomonas]|uniref:DUF4132 domain-containing protein n=1 Tax=unclassified Pseudomonas TaxID=196821 RepID=UPI00211587DE|nr:MULTISPECIES: DUF4132 domain-containing protein [unclassified Pseudomonas]MDW3713842.1 DUF4132 domain-containing protein [Pseudomonas sp. 2023EL-01195]